MMYHAKVSEGEKRGDSIFRSEDYAAAKRAADNYKRDTGINCEVESRSVVYVTSTLEEAMAGCEVACAGSAHDFGTLAPKAMGRTHIGKLALVPTCDTAPQPYPAVKGEHRH